jgi:hypothetical protein
MLFVQLAVMNGFTMPFELLSVIDSKQGRDSGRFSNLVPPHRSLTMSRSIADLMALLQTRSALKPCIKRPEE